MLKRVYLIRHGETQGTAEGRIMGATDQPLSAHGTSQVLRLAELLPAGLLAPGAATWCVASPLQRAQQTAECVAGRAGLTITTDADLREMHFGAWEGLTSQEIEERFPRKQAQWASPTDDTAFPDGECLGDFQERVARAQKRILERPEDAVMVFTHGGVVRELICGFLGLGHESYWMFAVQPASVARVDVHDGGSGSPGAAALSGLWSVHDWEVE